MTAGILAPSVVGRAASDTGHTGVTRPSFGGVPANPPDERDARQAIMRYETYLWYGHTVEGQAAASEVHRMAKDLPRLRPLLEGRP